MSNNTYDVVISMGDVTIRNVEAEDVEDACEIALRRFNHSRDTEFEAHVPTFRVRMTTSLEVDVVADSARAARDQEVSRVLRHFAEDVIPGVTVREIGAVVFNENGLKCDVNE